MKKSILKCVLALLSITSYSQEVIEGITYESYNNAKNTYNYTYWNSNFKTEGEAIRKFTNQTSSYNLSVNYTKLSIASLNINSQGATPGEALQESNAATFTALQPGNIDFKILKEGAVLHEKNASSLKNFWTQVNHMYNMHGHGLAVKNTGALCDRSGGGRGSVASLQSPVMEPISFIPRAVCTLELAASRRPD
jgi:hypothetical protein